MGFLNYAILAALSLGTIPLLIHLLNRQRKIQMPFSTIRYIHQVHQKKAKKLQLKKILLLIIRTLMVLLLVLAISRPMLKSGVPGGAISAKGGKSYIILIDNSASMLAMSRNGKLLEQALVYTGKLVGKLGEGNTFIIGWLNKQDGSLSITRSGNVFLTRKILERIPETEFSFVWPEIFRTLYQQIPPPAMPLTALFIMSDGQMIQYDPHLIQPFQQKFPQCRIQVINVLDRQPFNISVDTLYFTNPQFIVNTQTHLQTVVHNYSNIPATDINLDLYIDNQRVAQKIISLEKGSRSVVDFAFTLKKAGIHQGWIKLQDDDLLEDNPYYFSFALPESLRILMVSDTGTDNYPLVKAITPIDTAVLFTIDTFSVFNLPSLDYQQYDGIILNQITAFPYYLMSNVRSFLGQKKNILYLLPMDGDMGLINRSFFDFLSLPTQLSSMESAYNRSGQTSRSTSFYTLKANPAAELLADLSDQGYWKNSRVLSRYRFMSKSQVGISMPLTFADNQPALMITPASSGGQVMISAFPLEDTYTDLIYHPIVVPFIQKILTFLISNNEGFQSRQYWSHQSIPATLYSELNMQTAILMRNGGDQGRPDLTDHRYEPGNYLVIDGVKPAVYFSVNLPPQESVFDAAGPVPDHFMSVQHLHDINDLNDLVNKLISGMEIAYYLIIMVTLLFIVESYLAKE